MAAQGPQARDGGRRSPGAVVAAVGATSGGVGVLALVTAPGVTRVDELAYDTTFVTAWWWLAYALVPVAAVVAWRVRAGYLTYVAVGAALVVPHVAVAALVVARYRWSGWSDGLEVFAFLHPLGLFAVAVVVLVVTGVVDALRRRRRTDLRQPA
ncbi:hypothetical protein WDZ17_05455 [Pseudokineococcus basanitobsidens]|uniref:Integral membrane protein n=1 Tax=Pseudokineococcus basanitobsidens TaxID=1926649 RepID=A0ABU8RI52_9ACTN